MTAGNPRLARTFAVTALVAGTLAAWLVSDYTGTVERRAGRPMQVWVAERPIAQGETLTAEMIGERTVPRAFAPADGVAEIESLEGARAVTDIGAGAYLTQPLFVTGQAAGAGYRLRRDERALTVDAKVSPDGASLQSGAIVDLFASGFAGSNETSSVLTAAEVIAAGEALAAQGQQRLTLRVANAQAAALIRADVFARELRAIVRP